MVPIIDNSHSGLPWSLSEELTTDIKDFLVRKGKLFLADLQTVSQVVSTFTEKNNPFSLESQWVKQAFSDYDYVVFLECIQHREDPIKPIKNSPAHLEMAVRIRLFDVRGSKPIVVLQEIVEESHYIPGLFTRSTSYQPDYGQAGYSISPMGKAHAELSAHIGNRIQQYIALHQTKQI